MENSGYRWFIAGTMLGAAGAIMGRTVMESTRKPGKRMRKSVANLAGKASREAGDLLGSVGEALADRMR